MCRQLATHTIRVSRRTEHGGAIARRRHENAIDATMRIVVATPRIVIAMVAATAAATAAAAAAVVEQAMATIIATAMVVVERSEGVLCRQRRRHGARVARPRSYRYTPPRPAPHFLPCRLRLNRRPLRLLPLLCCRSSREPCDRINSRDFLKLSIIVHLNVFTSTITIIDQWRARQ
jgi:hypothetical protein